MRSLLDWLMGCTPGQIKRRIRGRGRRGRTIRWYAVAAYGVLLAALVVWVVRS